MRLDPDGAQLFGAAVADTDIVAIAATFTGAAGRARPGLRLEAGMMQPSLIRAADEIAASLLGPGARAVMGTFFDKTPERNWSLSWHQDRTIAVRRHHPVPGYSNWTDRDAHWRCEPPFALLARMLTLRIHVDRVGDDNSPLLVALGSHRNRLTTVEIAAVVAASSIARCLAAPGDVWVYRLPILHMSEPARAPLRRRVLQLAYSADPLPAGLEWLGLSC
jgi:hypothetical protein